MSEGRERKRDGLSGKEGQNQGSETELDPSRQFRPYLQFSILLFFFRLWCVTGSVTVFTTSPRFSVRDVSIGPSRTSLTNHSARERAVQVHQLDSWNKTLPNYATSTLMFQDYFWNASTFRVSNFRSRLWTFVERYCQGALIPWGGYSVHTWPRAQIDLQLYLRV